MAAARVGMGEHEARGPRRVRDQENPRAQASVPQAGSQRIRHGSQGKSFARAHRDEEARVRGAKGRDGLPRLVGRESTVVERDPPSRRLDQGVRGGAKEGGRAVALLTSRIDKKGSG